MNFRELSEKCKENNIFSPSPSEQITIAKIRKGSSLNKMFGNWKISIKVEQGYSDAIIKTTLKIKFLWFWITVRHEFISANFATSAPELYEHAIKLCEQHYKRLAVNRKAAKGIDL